MVEVDITGGEPRGFQSTWAKSIEEDLRKAAEGNDLINDNDKVKERREERTRRGGREQLTEPVKQKPPIRKPIQVVNNWFGIDSSSEESEEDDDNWNTIDRKKKAEEKRKKAAHKRINRQKECAGKAAIMVSLGPVTAASVEFFRSTLVSYDEAKKLAIKEFLQYNLGYDEEELVSLEIMETRMSSKDDNIINVAMATEDAIRELYTRQAAIKNDDIVLRTYIPPNFHKRFMYLNSICADRRSEDPSLKTQLRFGKKDIEILVKTRGEDGGFKKVKMEDFVDPKEVPVFESNIKWRKYIEKPPRKQKVLQVDKGPRPSMLGQQAVKVKAVKSKESSRLPVPVKPVTEEGVKITEAQTKLIRVNSNTVTGSKKKPRFFHADSSPDESMNEDDNTGDGTL